MSRTSIEVTTDYVCGHERDEDDTGLTIMIDVDEDGKITNFYTSCSQCENQVHLEEDATLLIKRMAQSLDSIVHMTAEDKETNCHGAEPWEKKEDVVAQAQETMITPQQLERMIAQAAVIHNPDPQSPDAFNT